MKKLLLMFVCLLTSLFMWGQETVNLSNPDEDFVKASVLIASPGEKIYSIVGHACLRLECPSEGLDYVFSFEGEQVDNNVFRFFAGKLMMRVMAIPTNDYLAEYKSAGRGVTQYELDLPIKVKQLLWKQMDERIMATPVPYDYMTHSCSVSVLEWLETAIGYTNLDYGKWPEKYEGTRKEIAGAGTNDAWASAFCYTITGGKGDKTNVSNQSKVIIPAELVDLLHRTKAFGKAILKGKPVELASKTKELKYTWFTPMVLALILLFLAVANLLFHYRVIRYLIIAIGMALGLFVSYLVFFSSLTCTEWNWLVVPFFPFVWVFWKWRRFWLLPFAGLNIVWSIAIYLYPHIIVDSSCIVLSIATALTYVELYRNEKIHK